jgi:predicted enzyme related to lactoylglutathione lyase
MKIPATMLGSEQRLSKQAQRGRRWGLVLALLGVLACAESEAVDANEALRAAQQADATPAPDDTTAAAPAGTASDAAADAPRDIPAPVTSPLVWGFGIGITDVPAAVKFYTEVMKMTVEKEGVKRDDSTETVLYASEAKRGARLVLMKFDDQRNTRKITTKLVFQAQNASAVNRAAAKYPDYKSRLNFGIVQFDGPETYIHEVGGIFDSSGSRIAVPYPIAMGFSTSDLAASRRFYKSLGMTESRLGSFSVTDATGSGSIMEYSVKFSTGAGVVLQDWTPDRNSKDNPVKVVVFVPDAKALADKIVAAGGAIVKPAERTPVYDNRLVIVAKDLDGYIIELVQ